MARKIGSLKQLGPDKWLARVEHGYDKRGKRNTKSRTVYGTEHDAERELSKLVFEVAHDLSEFPKITLHDYYWDIFSPDRHEHATHATAQNYDSEFRVHIDPYFKDAELASITNMDVQRWIDQLPPQSAPNYTRLLRAIFSQARFDHAIRESPMERYRFRMPRGRDTTPKPVWGAREVAEALSRPAFVHDRMFPLWAVMCGGGLSRSEALALKWSDFRWVEYEGHWTAYISVRSAITATDGKKDPKNSRRYRALPIPSVFADKLHEVKDKGPICQSFKHGVNGGIKTGKCLTPDRVPENWKKLFEPGHPLEGMPFVWLNRMRATYATLMQGAGIDYSVINAMQGRSKNSEVLYGNYLNPQNETFERAADTLQQIVGSSHNIPQRK